MTFVINSPESIGSSYPTTTGRLKQVITESEGPHKKIALLGDSTLDNGYWVEKETAYSSKTYNVTHQTAVGLANKAQAGSYEIANFAVDGATTTDLLNSCFLDKVLPSDEDHPNEPVDQLKSAMKWQPDTVVLSVGGNNYREALASTLRQHLNFPQLLLRITPEDAKLHIYDAFQNVKRKLLREYKLIIDKLVVDNINLNRIVLLSQYYPAVTELTPYFIYTGFSHLARADGEGKPAFTAVEETMNELYREVLSYASTKNKEIVFVDMTSSLNPLGGNHSLQIEPNEQGSKIMGQLIAHAIDYQFAALEEKAIKQPSVVALRMNADETTINSMKLDARAINSYGVKKLSEYIDEDRYRHLRLLFSPTTSLETRYESAYQTLMGRTFDVDYSGMFAFGLLDLSLVTVAASLIWQVAADEDLHMPFRIIAGTMAAPILLAKFVVGLALMIVLALPIYGYHKAFSSLPESEDRKMQLEEDAKNQNSSLI